MALLVASLIQEHFGDSFAARELGRRWINIIRPLQEAEAKDADRAGEKLDVFSNVFGASNQQEWGFTLRIVGHDSGEEYAVVSCQLGGEDMVTDKLVELELHFVASLRAALNGVSRFTAEERVALNEALRFGGIACDFCDQRFAFFEEALSHEDACPARPTV